MATLEPHHGVTGGEFGEDSLDGLAIVGVDVVDERPGQQLLGGVPEEARERRIGALAVPVEPRDANASCERSKSLTSSSSKDQLA
jgi:hypothetical protein